MLCVATGWERGVVMMRARGIPVLILGALLLSSCSDDSPSAARPSATPSAKLALAPFDEDCADFRDYLADALAREVLEGYGPCWGCLPLDDPTMLTGAPAVMGPSAGDAAVGAESAPHAVSGTNVQEAGVDEADLLEADAAGYFYVVRGQELLVIDAVPAETMDIVARVPLETVGYARGLYLDPERERLAVLIDFTGPDYPSAAPFPARFGTGVLFVDVADPAQPVATNWYWTEGYAVDSRRIDARLHLVSRYAYALPPGLRDDADFQQLVSDYYQARFGGHGFAADALAARIRSRVATAVADAPLADLLPLHKSGLGDAPAVPLACAQVQRADVDHRMGLILITSVDTDGANDARLATVNNAWQLYASATNLYLVQHSAGWWFEPDQRQQTAIYRFALTDSAAVPDGFGMVDGWTLNAYSFGEHEGFLRVATTESSLQGDTIHQTNHLFVLGEGGDGNLEVVGAVRDFIQDERIFSSRFLGTRGFVVTFRQVDPLFAFDLADPRAPVLAGQVEIPGFSTYLHPVGDGHLLTIGRAGEFNNLQLQLFDVADLAHPALADAYVPDIGPDAYVFSLAEFDPHAFTYFAPAGVLSVPVQIGAHDPAQAFSGFFALAVDPATGFTELGRVDHTVAYDGGGGCPDGREAEMAMCADLAPVSYGWPLRSVVVAEEGRTLLYTLSDHALRAGDLADLSVVLADVPLDPP